MSGQTSSGSESSSDGDVDHRRRTRKPSEEKDNVKAYCPVFFWFGLLAFGIAVGENGEVKEARQP